MPFRIDIIYDFQSVFEIVKVMIEQPRAERSTVSGVRLIKSIFKSAPMLDVNWRAPTSRFETDRYATQFLDSLMGRYCVDIDR
jgi:hypothetical protein